MKTPEPGRGDGTRILNRFVSRFEMFKSLRLQIPFVVLFANANGVKFDVISPMRIGTSSTRFGSRATFSALTDH